MTDSKKDPSNMNSGLWPGKVSLPSRRLARFMLLARKINLGNRFEIILSVLAVIAAVITFIAMSRKDAPFDITSGRTMTVLLYINLVLLLALGASVGRWFVRIWLARRSGAAGSRLHTRVTGVFIAIAIFPPIIMAVFSFLFLEFGIRTWFSEKVRTTLNSSLEVAEAYLVEHRATIEQDMVAIAIAYSNMDAIERINLASMQRVADSALSTRLLSEVIVFEERDGHGSYLASASQGLELTTSRIPDDYINRVRRGEIVIASNQADKTVIAMTRMYSFANPTYLYLARDLNPQVLGYLESTRNAVQNYETLEGQQTSVQLQFSVVFIIISLLILLAAIWVGLWFSSRLVTPLSHLVNASERIGQGDLDVRVPSLPTGDEVGTLSRAFNRMTDQISRSQDALVEANLELDERRRFLEEVLESVSAGIIGLTADTGVYLPNKSALKLLGVQAGDIMSVPLGRAVPEFSRLINLATHSETSFVQDQIALDVGGETCILLVRITAQRGVDGLLQSYVVTFDDLTDQLANQRTAAWSDVARRIAHEIKNPLTPIQLSAERLKRKYLKEIETDPAIFSQCTDTIIRQVGDLRRMVDEFSSFARMPTPLFKHTDVVDLIRQSVFLQNVAHPSVTFTTDLDAIKVSVLCDGRLVGQAFTNLIKNAAESVVARIENDKMSENKLIESETIESGHVGIRCEQNEHETVIIVKDNGIGLPQGHKDRLMEPYVTTRTKGTGLGLAIVRRIMEEHGGTVRLYDRRPIGARAVMTFNHSALEVRAERSRSHNEDSKNAAE